VTFTDSTNNSDVAAINGNGTYSANLSNLTNGTLTYLLTASNAAGNIINVDPTTTLGGYNDGSANAPAGTPQLPNLLSGYAVRPPWKVAGVDYAVGVPAGTTLQDWETLSIPGVTVEKNYVAITGSNITLNGIDFSLHGGAKVDIFGSNDTIINSNFLYGPAMAAASASGIMGGTGSNVTLKYDTFNGNGTALGNGASSQSAILSESWTGTNTIEYNYFSNFNQHVVEEEGSSSLIYEYNLIYDGGTGAAGAHVNYLQMGNNVYPSLTVEFNTTYQPTVNVSGGEGFQLYPNGGGTTNATLAYNTMIYGPDGTGAVHVPGGDGNGTVTAAIYDNYVNKQNGGSYFYPDPNAGTLDKYSGDISLVTGALIDAPDAPVIVSDTVNGNVVTLNGTADANVTINVYDGTTQIGTTTSNSSGAWAFTSGSLAAGTHAFTTTATTVPLQSGLGGNTSAASAPLDPTIGSVTSPSGSKTGSSNSGAGSSGSGTNPTIAYIAESPSNGDLNAGKTVTFTLNLNEAVTVAGGTPTLTLNDGGTATYARGSGTNALTFSYTVGAGQNTSALAATVVNLNSATITDGAGNAANLALSGLTQSGPQIDTITPTVSSLTESPASGDLNAAKTVTLTLNLSEAVAIAGGTPTLTLNDGGTATYSGGSGTKALTFSYTVVAGQNTAALAATAVNLNSATIIDGAGNAANLSLSGLTQDGPQIDTTASAGSGTTSSGPSGSTLTAPTISSISPDSGEAGGGYTNAHVLTVMGTAAANGKVEVFDGSTLLGTANANGNGAWSFTTPTLSDGTQSFTAKDVDTAGNTSAASAALTVTVVSAATVTQAGSTYDVSTPASDPVLKYEGADVTAGQFGTWVPFAAVQTVSGYDVAWKETNADEYTVWTTDVNGNYTGNLIGAVAGNSTTWDSLEPIFGTTSSLSRTVIQTDGSTSLTEVENQFYLDSSSGSDPALKYQNANVTAGQFGAWKPIGAVQTASGYDVAWKNTTSGQYTVWTTNSNGNYTGNLIGPVSGTSTALEALEPIFDQNLNGDGKLTSTVIQTDGSTKLTKVADQVSSAYYLNGINGSGPALKYQSADVTGGEFGAWTPIGAVQTASGYDVAWKNTTSGQYTVWTTNSNGNYTGNLTGAVSGTSTTLESLEPIFSHDLNGDGVIGIYVAPNATLKISSSLAGSSGATTIGAGATLEIAAADSASITFQGTTGTLRLDQASTFSGQIFGFKGNGSLSGSDHIDLTSIKYSSIKDSYANGVLTVTDGSGDTAKLNFNGSYTLANFKFASDGSGGTVVYDPPVSSSSGQDTAGPGPGVLSSAIGTREIPALTGLPDRAFNLESARGHLLDSNAAGGIVPGVEDIPNGNIALLGEYMASTFAVVGNHGAATAGAEMAQANDHAVLSNPSHT
jgi:hypothetical protein